jgi:fucose 4-O-acetylase-like acetyltransferase
VRLEGGHVTTLPNSFLDITDRDAGSVLARDEEAAAPAATRSGDARNLPLGYLRAFLTLMVVAHHAVLAYHRYAPPPAASLDRTMWWAAFPVVDSHKWLGIELFTGYNDTFFMALMFLLSGVFAWPSLTRKGASAFARERILRLGLPFLAGAALLAPLAYYPTYLLGAKSGSFWKQWLAIGAWPAGPAWFLWVLLAFGLAAAALFKLAPNWGDVLGRIEARLAARPVVFFGALIAVSALVYLPMAALFSPERWLSFGPFFAQTSRLFLYAVYFFAGAGLGAYGVGRGLLAPEGKLARRWYVWAVASLATFIVSIVTVVIILGTLSRGGPGRGLSTFGNLTFVLTCTAASMAFLAWFLRFVRKANPLFESLSRNAYGIYILHYFCVSWLQFALVRADLPGSVKGTLVFLGAVALSWTMTAALRRIPAIARVI